MNKTRRILAAGLALALFSGGVLAGDSNGDWVKLGSVNAGHDADHDRITVTGQHDNYRKLKFKVKNAALNMRQVVVTYDDGAPERLDVKENLAAGAETRVIDLHGGKRKQCGHCRERRESRGDTLTSRGEVTSPQNGDPALSLQFCGSSPQSIQINVRGGGKRSRRRRAIAPQPGR